MTVAEQPEREGFHDVDFDSKRRAAIVVLILTFLLFGGSIAINLYQGHRTGAGTGFNDTKVLNLDHGQHFFDGTIPKP